MRNLKEERLGAEGENSIGDKMKVIEYIDSNHIVVEFLDDFHSKVKTTWHYFSSGYVTNPYGKYVCGVGSTCGENIFDNNGALIKEYSTWSHMLRRCYSNSGRDRDASYVECTVSDEWHYFSNFKKWVQSQDNYSNWVNLENGAIDKDILIKGNKIYSPEACTLVPGYVNNLFTKHNSKRGKYCIGVSYHKRDKVFTATCNNPFTKKSDHLGYFKTEQDAFNEYKIIKEAFIKAVAEQEYSKGNITKECYEAMMKYQVEITD